MLKKFQSRLFHRTATVAVESNPEDEPIDQINNSIIDYSYFIQSYNSFTSKTVRKILLSTSGIQSGFTELYASILVIKVDGFNSIENNLTAKEYYLIARQFYTDTFEIIEKYHGDIIRVFDDTLIIAWPIESSSLAETKETSAKIAATCAAHLMIKFAKCEKSLGNKAIKFTLQCGIGTGIVSCFLFHSDDMSEFFMLGDSITECYEALALGRPCEVIISPTVNKCIDGSLETFPVENEFFKLNYPFPSEDNGSNDSNTSWELVPFRQEEDQTNETTNASSINIARNHSFSSMNLSVDELQQLMRLSHIPASYDVFTFLKSTNQIGDSCRIEMTSQQLNKFAKKLRKFIPLIPCQAIEDCKLASISELQNVAISIIRIKSFNTKQLLFSFEQLQRLIKSLIKIFAKFNGNILQFHIDHCSLIVKTMFGVRDDNLDSNCLRALSSTLTVTRSLAHTPFNVQSGVAGSRCYCGIIGSSDREEYQTIGHLNIVASSLMNQAGDNGIVVNKEIFVRTMDRFKFSECKKLRVGDRMIANYTVLEWFSEMKARLIDGSTASVFIGRCNEITKFKKAIENFEKSKTDSINWWGKQFHLVSGPRWSGKSTMLCEIYRLLTPKFSKIAVAICECRAYMAPYSTIKLIFDQMFGNFTSQANADQCPKDDYLQSILDWASAFANEVQVKYDIARANTKSSGPRSLSSKTMDCENSELRNEHENIVAEEEHMGADHFTSPLTAVVPLLAEIFPTSLPKTDVLNQFHSSKLKRLISEEILVSILQVALSKLDYVILLENLHWCDMYSLKILQRLLTSVSRGFFVATIDSSHDIRAKISDSMTLADIAHCFLFDSTPWDSKGLLTNNEIDGYLSHFKTFFDITELSSLNVGDALQIMKLLLGSRLADDHAEVFREHFIQKLMLSAQGNFFSMRTICSFVKEKLLESEELLMTGVNLSHIPDDIKVYFLNRLCSLTERERRILNIAAVLGKVFKSDEVVQMLTLRQFKVATAEVSNILTHLESMHYLRSLNCQQKGLFTFENNMMRAFIYQECKSHDIEEYHYLAADILATTRKSSLGGYPSSAAHAILSSDIQMKLIYSDIFLELARESHDNFVAYKCLQHEIQVGTNCSILAILSSCYKNVNKFERVSSLFKIGSSKLLKKSSSPQISPELVNIWFEVDRVQPCLELTNSAIELFQSAFSDKYPFENLSSTGLQVLLTWHHYSRLILLAEYYFKVGDIKVSQNLCMLAMTGFNLRINKRQGKLPSELQPFEKEIIRCELILLKIFLIRAMVKQAVVLVQSLLIQVESEQFENESIQLQCCQGVVSLARGDIIMATRIKNRLASLSFVPSESAGVVHMLNAFILSGAGHFSQAKGQLRYAKEDFERTADSFMYANSILISNWLCLFMGQFDKVHKAVKELPSSNIYAWKEDLRILIACFDAQTNLECHESFDFSESELEGMNGLSVVLRCFVMNDAGLAMSPVTIKRLITFCQRFYQGKKEVVNCVVFFHFFCALFVLLHYYDERSSSKSKPGSVKATLSNQITPLGEIKGCITASLSFMHKCLPSMPSMTLLYQTLEWMGFRILAIGKPPNDFDDIVDSLVKEFHEFTLGKAYLYKEAAVYYRFQQKRSQLGRSGSRGLLRAALSIKSNDMPDASHHRQQRDKDYNEMSETMFKSLSSKSSKCSTKVDSIC